ncbi:hypothetical protein HUN19_17575 [Acinetobacter oleivorans]|uniref:hypothetical protein n=1 Tax=Acinetobacter oleivorans TaxID=1148157 RepID=UPI001580540A|nr:hypothetical protein [Acinetobacter oleivorans]NUF35794.1 hypothetical protein [Acinetobacter oleivorans]
MNFQTILLSFQNQSTGTDAFKDLKNSCEQSLKESQNTKEKAAVYLIYGFARSYVILYEDEAVTSEFANTSKSMLIDYMECLNEALLNQNDSAILDALNQVSDDYIKSSRVF